MNNIYILCLFIGCLLNANAQSYELLPLDYVPGNIYTISANEPTGQIMVGGSFNESAGSPYAKFAIMEDDEFVNPWSGLPADDSEGILDFAVSHGITYAGGASEDPMWRLSKRNTVSGIWESSEISIDGDIYALDTMSDGNLLVLGDFTTPYTDAFIYDGENVSPLNGFSIEGTPFGVTSFDGKYYINYFSDPQDLQNIFVWDESCECESIDGTNLPTNFIVYAVGKSEDKLYVSLWNFNEGDKEFYESSDGINFEVIGTMDGTILGIKSHNDLVYFYGDIFELNGEEVNPIVAYDTNTDLWESIGGVSIAGTGIAQSADFMGDELYVSIGWYLFVYRAETPVDTTEEDTVTISVFDFEKNINIYPNPATSFVTIEVLNVENLFDLEVIIFNSFGEIVRPSATHANNSKITIDIENLPTGIYSVKSEKFIERFIKL